MATDAHTILEQLAPPTLAGMALFATIAGTVAAGSPLPANKPDFTKETAIDLLYTAGKAAKASELAPGVSYRLIALADYGLKIHVWSFDKTRYRLRAADDQDPHGSRVADLLGSKDVFAINGG